MFSRNKIAKNASWIIGCRIAQSVIALIIGMLTARYLGPSNFGVINYAASMVAFFTPIMQLGLNNIIVQEIVNHPDQESKILGTSILMSLFSAMFCVVGLFATVSFLNPGENETIVVCCLYSSILVFQAADLIRYWFQSKYLAKYTSIATFVAYLLVASYRVFLLVSGKSVYWFAVSNALDGLLLAFFFVILYRKKGGPGFSFSLKVAKRLFSKSHFCMASSLIGIVFMQIDRVMIKNMLGNAETGFYSAAVTCAVMTNFVFGAIIDSFRPQIFENKKNDAVAYEKSMINLYSIILYLALAQSLVMTFFAPLIIKVLYGVAYLPSVVVLQIFAWCTTFSYLEAVRNEWIVAESKQRFLWFISLFASLSNALFNYFLIPIWGINGAASASLLAHLFVLFIVGFAIKPIRNNNRLLLLSINPKNLVNLLRK